MHAEGVNKSLPKVDLAAHSAAIRARRRAKRSTSITSSAIEGQYLPMPATRSASSVQIAPSSADDIPIYRAVVPTSVFWTRLSSSVMTAEDITQRFSPSGWSLLTRAEQKGRLSSFFFPHTSGDEILIGAAAFPFGSYFIHQIVKLQRTPSDAAEREGLRLAHFWTAPNSP
jgi:hypothetical protein